MNKSDSPSNLSSSVWVDIIPPAPVQTSSAEIYLLVVFFITTLISIALYYALNNKQKKLRQLKNIKRRQATTQHDRKQKLLDASNCLAGNLNVSSMHQIPIPGSNPEKWISYREIMIKHCYSKTVPNDCKVNELIDEAIYWVKCDGIHRIT